VVGKPNNIDVSSKPALAGFFSKRTEFMASHVFHEIYLHINWHVKSNHPLLTAKLEPLTKIAHRFC
jgi:hypothetical protein